MRVSVSCMCQLCDRLTVRQGFTLPPAHWDRLQSPLSRISGLEEWVNEWTILRLHIVNYTDIQSEQIVTLASADHVRYFSVYWGLLVYQMRGSLPLCFLNATTAVGIRNK